MEIERKFLLKNNDWRSHILSSIEIKQGYISDVPERTVRIRIAQNKAWLTIKGKTEGIKREEFEFEIDKADAEKMFNIFCGKNRIIKTRHIVNYQNQKWEIDEFEDKLKGLIIAEIELTSEDEVIEMPKWIGKEVSHDARYFNSNLVKETFIDESFL
ncbi:MAG: CYTH domain-containing protein [Candidatus Riflebacteria bacterium]|nr:CYTH domain-containing protein [Candidatus Riflebacteria bacterium]